MDNHLPNYSRAPDANPSQTDDLTGQQQRRFDPASSGTSPQNFWDIAGSLNVDSALASPSSAPTSLSFESFGQPTPAPNRPNQPRSQQGFGQGSRVILPPRPPKSKAGHERKRTKLSTESTPFDNVDYWLQFDNEEGTGDGTNAELSHQKAKEARRSQQQQQQQQQQDEQAQQSPNQAQTQQPSR